MDKEAQVDGVHAALRGMCSGMYNSNTYFPSWPKVPCAHCSHAGLGALLDLVLRAWLRDDALPLWS
jgi:hypothetical protein